MTANEIKHKLQASKATSYEVLRAMSDELFAEYEIFNAAKAIRWTIKTGRVGALVEKIVDDLSGPDTVDLVVTVAEASEEITLHKASQAFIKIIRSRK